MQPAHASLALLALLSSLAVRAADPLLPSASAVAVEQALAGNIRLVVWELSNGVIEVQALDATTHLPLSERRALGRQEAGGLEPVLAGTQTRPAVAGLPDAGGDAVFFVAWHAEVDAGGSNAGTEIIGQRVFVDDATGDISADHLLRVSRVDDDADFTAVSEARSAPVVVANPVEEEFLVLWTHWPNGRSLDGDSVSHDEYFIYSQEIGKDGGFRGSVEALRLDSLTAPADDDGLHARRDGDVIFLAAAALPDEPGYLLAWSDPSQEDRNSDGVVEDLSQLFTKRLPASVGDTNVNARNALAQSTRFDIGTGRIALAELPDGEGFLLAWEDVRGMQPLLGMLLDAMGASVSEPVKLLDLTLPGDDAFLSPKLVTVAEEGKVLLYAVIGTHGFDDPDQLVIEPARLARRVLDPTSGETLTFISNFSEVDTEAGEYPPVSIFFAAQAHAVGALPHSDGAVSFVARPMASEIIVNEFLFATEPPPPPPPPPPTNDENDGGGGATFALLFLLPFARSRRMNAMFAGGLLLSAAANASPPDLELLHTDKDGSACYRAVVYREVSEIRLGNSYSRTPIPPGTPVEIVSLPTGWNAEVLTEKKYQWVRLRPAPFDTISGISIGRICMKFPAMPVAAHDMPYTFHLVPTDSLIMATARRDDGVSDDELRAMIRRGDRLKQGTLPGKPKELEDAVKTLKRAKDLFD